MHQSDREVFSTLHAWAYRAQTLMHQSLPVMKQFFDEEAPEHEKSDFVLGQLSTNCLMITESAILLTSALRLWDAEILVRSVLEGSIKFFYLCEPGEAERLQRVKEYSEDLFEIHRLKRHLRAEKLLSLVPNPEDVQWRPIRDLLISEAELAELRAKHPKASRRILEDKWSFTPMLEALANSSRNGATTLLGFTFMYGMSSHQAHMDGVAINMVLDRARRSTERRKAIEIAHGARLLSDLLHMMYLRMRAAVELKGLPTTRLEVWNIDMQRLLADFHEAESRWSSIEYGDASEDSPK